MKKRLLSSLALLLMTFLIHQVNTKSVIHAKNPSVITPPTKGPPILNEVIDKTVLAQARDNVELKCPIGGDPPIIYEWYKGPNESEMIDDSWDRFYLSPNDPHLNIRSVTQEDSGTYSCKAINGFGLMSARIQLSVTGDDPFKDNLLKSSTSKRSNQNGITSAPEILMDQLPKEKVLRKSKGENLLLKCEAKGNPRPNITWLKDNLVLTGSRDNISSLKLTNMSEGTSGTYKCEASNIFGISKYEVQVVVTGSWIGKAEILRLSPTNLTLFPGESGNITCVARFESESHPTFVWVKKLREKPDPESKKIVYHEGKPYEVLSRPEWNEKEKYVFTTDLILTNVSRADTGSYHCVVYGLMGYIHSEAQVFVQNDPSQVQSVKLNKEKEVTVRWVILWASAFLVVAVMIVTCFVRLHGCRTQPKRVPVLRTPAPKKSPGETVSTTLTHHNDVFQGLLDENLTMTSSSGQRVERSMRCSSGLSGLPESDVTDIMPSTKRTRSSRHPKPNLYSGMPPDSDIDSYRFFPRAPAPPHQRNLGGNLPHPGATRQEKRRSSSGHRSSRSRSRKHHEEFSDMDMFPSSASAYCQPIPTQESRHFSCSSASLTSSSQGAGVPQCYPQHYFQPPSSPVSTHSYPKRNYSQGQGISV